MSNNTITPAEALVIADLVNYTEQGISSRVLAKNGAGHPRSVNGCRCGQA